MKTDTTDGQPLDKTLGANGQQKNYIILSDDERAKGFVRPVRNSYRHVGIRPKHPVRDLTHEEYDRYNEFGYVKYEEYPPELSPLTGRFWTKSQLESGCNTVTTMGRALAETYAAKPDLYGATMCSCCGKHLPVGADGEFVWEGTNERVGT